MRKRDDKWGSTKRSSSFFTTKEHKIWFLPNKAKNDEIMLTSRNWTRPTGIVLTVKNSNRLFSRRLVICNL